MRSLTVSWMLVFMLGLSACSGGGIGLALPGLGRSTGATERPFDVSLLPSMRVVALEVEVPRSLTVSEAGGYKPVADILWRGDPYGDRYAQVDKVMTDGLTAGALTLQGNLPVSISIVMTRFHAVTNQTRYSIGGLHEIEFDMVVSNASTGEIVIPQYHIDATFPTLAGEAAVQADIVGLTQKRRILDQLARIIPQELAGSAPVQTPVQLPET